MSGRSIRLIAFDVDGTLTPGTLTIGADGEVFKVFYAKDGLAISLAHKLGYVTGLVTGRTSQAVEKRREELHMDFAVMGAADKIAAMEEIQKQYGISWEETAYMGDDLNDLAVLGRTGLGGAPSDGAEEVKQAAGFVSRFPGGRGAAREFIEYILKREGRWEEALALFREEKIAAKQ